LASESKKRSRRSARDRARPRRAAADTRRSTELIDLDATPPATPRPLKRPPRLFTETQSQLRTIEELLGAPLLVYWNSGGGSVCDNDVVGLYELLRQSTRREKVFMFIKSDGGSGQAALRIVHLLREFADRVCALVPMECMSAATMIALGADEILMGPIARLSAVDTSLRHALSPLDRENDRVSVSQNEVQRILSHWRELSHGSQTHPYEALFKYVHPLVIGAVDRATSLSIRLCEEILGYHMTDSEAIKQISDKLNSDYPAHSYPITLREAQRIGLNAAPLPSQVNDALLQLNEQYSEMGQSAVTDFDENNQHTNRILNILERSGLQVFYQLDKDWRYRAEERRWVSLNDESSWRRVEMVDGRPQESKLHIN